MLAGGRSALVPAPSRSRPSRPGPIRAWDRRRQRPCVPGEGPWKPVERERTVTVIRVRGRTWEHVAPTLGPLRLGGCTGSGTGAAIPVRRRRTWLIRWILALRRRHSRQVTGRTRPRRLRAGGTARRSWCHAHACAPGAGTRVNVVPLAARWAAFREGERDAVRLRHARRGRPRFVARAR